MSDTASVTVITPAIPPRLASFLPDAIASVAAQTVKPAAHLIGVDYAAQGCAPTMRRLAAGVTTEWVVPLSDDDVLHPPFIEACLEVAGDADVVYPFCEFDGPEPNGIVVNLPVFDRDLLQIGNYIPSTTLIRAEAARAVGWWPDTEDKCEDWALWKLLVAAGATFLPLPEPLWTYRFHGQQTTTKTLPEWT